MWLPETTCKQTRLVPRILSEVVDLQGVHSFSRYGLASRKGGSGIKCIVDDMSLSPEYRVATAHISWLGELEWASTRLGSLLDTLPFLPDRSKMSKVGLILADVILDHHSIRDLRTDPSILDDALVCFLVHINIRHRRLLLHHTPINWHRALHHQTTGGYEISCDQVRGKTLCKLLLCVYKYRHAVRAATVIGEDVTVDSTTTVIPRSAV